jgi:hypothetical protein
VHLGLVGRNARRGYSGASVLSDCCQLGRVEQVVVAVGAEIDPDPVDLSGEGVVAGRIVVADGRAGVAADVGGFIQGVDVGVGSFHPSAGDLVAVHIEGGGAALAEPAAVVGELHAQLMLAGAQGLLGGDGGALQAEEAVVVARAAVLEVQHPAPVMPPWLTITPRASSPGTTSSAVTECDLFLMLSMAFSVRPTMPPNSTWESPWISLGATG